jgi:hypothetical protein
LSTSSTKEINAALAGPKLKVRIVDLGETVLADSPAHFGSSIAYKTEKWAQVIKFSRAKPD